MSDKTIMDRLKEETWPLHQQAERAALEQDLVKGKLPREVYREYLAQRLVIHAALESCLREARGGDARLAAVVQDYQFHEPRVAADLKYFGGDPLAASPLAATQKLIDAIHGAAKSNPVSLLGFQYVFEGSMNGARFIARAVRGAWRLAGIEGTQYLDPYGEEQRDKWAAFKETVNAQPFTAEEADAIVEAGKATFRQMIDVEAEIYPESSRAAS